MPIYCQENKRKNRYHHFSKKMYCSMIVSVSFLAVSTQPDLTFSLSALSSHLHDLAFNISHYRNDCCVTFRRHRIMVYISHSFQRLVCITFALPFIPIGVVLRKSDALQPHFCSQSTDRRYIGIQDYKQ